LSPAELRGAVLKGRASAELLRRIVEEAEVSMVLNEEDREAVLEGLGDWL
jgi:hypothetical protein